MEAEIRPLNPKGFAPFEVVFKIETIQDAEEFVEEFDKTSYNYCAHIHSSVQQKIKEFKNG